VLIICLVVLATLLFCDAWFDVVLDARTAGFELSLLSAVVIELPPAALAGWGARRLLLTSVNVVRRYEGEQGPPRSLWQPSLSAASACPQRVRLGCHGLSDDGRRSTGPSARRPGCLSWTLPMPPIRASGLTRPKPWDLPGSKTQPQFRNAIGLGQAAGPPCEP
jgi:hypothetical protein